jgi:beta-glucanase (GH16 family)
MPAPVPLFLGTREYRNRTAMIPFPDPVGESAGVWQGVFRDEFDNGTKPDTAIWADHLIEGDHYRTNTNSVEVQWYPHDKRGLSVGNSYLTLTARNESPYLADPLCPNPLPSGNTGTWTAGMVQSRPGFQMTYGYIESRIRFPTAANGQWPAFWTFGGDAGWPPEFDIAEVFHGTEIRYNYFNNAGTVFGASAGFSDNNTFHVWGLKWDAGAARFYRDGVQVHSYSAAAITSVPQHIVYNFAVRNDATPLGAGPWRMDIDYVRAWNLVGCPDRPVISNISPTTGIPTAGSITVTFGAVAGATSYRVSAGPTDSWEDGVSTSLHPSQTGSSSPITVTGLTNGARYNVTVAAINATGYSVESVPAPLVRG